MNPKSLIEEMRSSVNAEISTFIDEQCHSYTDDFVEMIRYQMGIGNENGAAGKRIRPLMVLAGCHAMGGDWKTALPAAAAMELVHNFSLVHDDIQDHSLTRRGKETVWAKWGEAQAINVGDVILTMSNLEVLSLEKSDIVIKKCNQTIQKAILELTYGQYMDLAFEHSGSVQIEDYWRMVTGKTGALFSASLALGALMAGKTDLEVDRVAALGNQLGLAFQVQDDYLGIWGDFQLTGKSSDSDIKNRKKSYPILYAFQTIEKFRSIWSEQEIFSPEHTSQLKSIMEEYHIDQCANKLAESLYEEVMKNMRATYPDQERSVSLFALVESLLHRKK